MKKGVFIHVILFFFLMSAGCAYYNTFYNAKKYFKQAAKERKKRKTDKITPAERDNYKKTIEKASRLLEFYPDSKYVDDALMLLGQCFFYQEEYHKAIRKFNELLAYDPGSEFIPEARLWLAKSYTRLQDFENAKTVFRQIINSNASQEIKDEGLLLVGELYVEREDYLSAAQEFEIAVNKIKDKKIKNRAGFLLGQSYYELAEYEKALEGFRIAVKHSYDEETENSALAYIALCHKGLRNYKEAMKVLSELLGKDSYEEHWPDAKVEMAKCINSNGNAEEAMEWYYNIIEDHRRTEASAEAYYHLGEIYETIYFNYDSAYANYDKVKSQFNRAAVSDTANLRMKNIVELLSLIEVIKTQETGKASDLDLDFEEEALDDTTLFRFKVKKAIRQLVRFRTMKPFIPLPDTLVSDSLLADSLSLDTLWDKGVKDWGKGLVVSKRWGISDTVNVADLERYGYIPDDEFSDDQFADNEEELSGKNNQNKHSPLQKMKSRMLQLAKNSSVRNMLNLAELYFFEHSLYDSSLIYFDKILEMKADSSVGEVVPYVLYSIAYIYENAKLDSIRADSIYWNLAEKYPKSPQGQKARELLNLPPLEVEKDPAVIEFFEIEKLFANKENMEKAAERYLEIEQKYPDTEIAARSLYASGFIYDTELNANDQASGIYNQLLEKYPNSEYAKKVRLKIDAVKKEQERIEAERKKQLEADSLANIKTDSLAIAGGDSLSQTASDSLAMAGVDSLSQPASDSVTKVGADSLSRVAADSLTKTGANTVKSDSMMSEKSEPSIKKQAAEKQQKPPDKLKGRETPGKEEPVPNKNTEPDSTLKPD